MLNIMKKPEVKVELEETKLKSQDNIINSDFKDSEELDNLNFPKSPITEEDLLGDKKIHVTSNIKFVIFAGLVLLTFSTGLVVGWFTSKESPMSQDFVSQIPPKIQDIYKFKQRACGGSALNDKYGKAICTLAREQVNKSVKIVDLKVSELLGQTEYLDRDGTEISPEIQVTTLEVKPEPVREIDKKPIPNLLSTDSKNKLELMKNNF